MKLLDNPYWRILVDVATVIGGIPILITGFLWLTSAILSIDNYIIEFLLITLLAIVFIFSLAIYKPRISKLLFRYKEKRIISGIEKLSEKFDIQTSDIIPPKNLIIQTFDLINEEAKHWDKTAKRGVENIYIEIRDHEISYRLHAAYSSDIKNLTRYFHMSSNYGKSDTYEELNPWSMLGEKSLSEKFPKWYEVSQKCLAAMSDRLPEDFEMYIQQNGLDWMSVGFQYKEGKVNKKYRFDYDNKLIKDSTTQKTFTLD